MGALLSEPVTAIVVEQCASNSWTASIATMQGWRRNHEDAHILWAGDKSSSSRRFVGQPGVFGILDGHGGQAAAEHGSRLLEEHLAEMVVCGRLDGRMDISAAEALLQAVFLRVDAELREILQPQDRSGTTVVAAIVLPVSPTEYCVHMAHSGDSRVVLCRRGQLVCSEDHKPGREDEARRIRAAGGSIAQGPLGGGPLRVDGALAVSRALGDFHFKPVEMTPQQCKVTANPEVCTVEGCSAGDWVLLACDGIFDVMSNEEVHDFIEGYLKGAPKPDIAKVLADLLQHCMHKGSKDNCTACLVQLHPSLAVPKSRFLLQGGWCNATSEVQQKYADFFRQHGFEAEADLVQRTTESNGRRPSQPRSSVGRGRGAGAAPGAPPSMPGATPMVKAPAQFARGASGKGEISAADIAAMPPAQRQRQLMCFAKAVQAMRSTRAIQGAWRSRRSAAAAGIPSAGNEERVPGSSASGSAPWGPVVAAKVKAAAAARGLASS